MATYNPKPTPQSDQEAFNNVWQHFIVEGNPYAFDPTFELEKLCPGCAGDLAIEEVTR